MNLTQLRYFVMIADEQSMSAAAAKVPVALPSMSRTLHSLEDELKTRLFDRVHGRLELNDAGRIFYKRAREALRQIDLGTREIENMSRLAQQKVRILIRSGHRILPPLMENFRKVYPDAEFEVTHYMLNPEESAYDLIMTNAQNIPDGWPHCLAAEREIVAVFSESSPLASKSYVNLDELATQIYFQVTGHQNPPQKNGTYVADPLCTELGFHPNSTYRISLDSTLRLFLSDNAGFTLWVKSSLSEILMPGLCAVPIGRNGFHNNIYLCKKINAPITRASKDFYDFTEHLSEFYSLSLT